MGISNSLLGCINCFTVCLSLPFLIVGFMIRNAASSPCDPVMYKPLIALGGSLLIISLLGLLGGCCRITIFLWIYAIALLILIVGLLVSLIIGGIIVKGKPKVEDANGEYQIDGFSSWLRQKIVGSNEWEDIQKCMIRHEACSKMQNVRSILNIVTLNTSKLTSIEVGCCKPPTQCGLEPEGEGGWKIPDKGLSSQDQDCKKWNNDKDKLCYNCDSCKAGYLAAFVKGWRKVNKLNALFIVITFVIFIIAICAIC